MYLVTVMGFGLWSAYGMMLQSWPLIVSNLISLSLAAAVLVLKLRYGDGPNGKAPELSSGAIVPVVLVAIWLSRL